MNLGDWTICANAPTSNMLTFSVERGWIASQGGVVFIRQSPPGVWPTVDTDSQKLFRFAAAQRQTAFLRRRRPSTGTPDKSADHRHTRWPSL